MVIPSRRLRASACRCRVSVKAVIKMAVVTLWGESKTQCYITKTCLYNFVPLKPHFYIVKFGFTGVYIIFLISAQKHRLWVLVRTASAVLTSTTIYVLSRNLKNIRIFLCESFHFLVVKCSVYLNRHVFLMNI